MSQGGALQQVNLKGRDFLELDDYSPEEIQYLIDLAIEIKRKHKNGEAYQPLKGKTLGLIFEKSSTRTRVSFEVGMYQLGGHALFLSKNDIQLGRGEPISDMAQVMSRYLDGIMIRTFGHDNVVELARYASVPVINGLSDLAHPCQVLADYQTLYEQKGKLKGLKLAYVGDGNNMAHSLLIGGAKLGVHVSIASPAGYEPDPSVVAVSREIAKQTGSEIVITQSPQEAVKDADAIYTDVWASMGFEEEQKERELAFADFQVNEELVKLAKPDYLFLHCLPAHRGEEVSAGVIDGPNSVIFDEAENRLHAQKALLVALIG
ncbi:MULTISPECIES: ornithine carbamoyltransferase [Paenibacillus]|uniref:ornithine carbamoyltransferase n=1 Tax=Paenibacillus TaxID=44249 RepID=UPI000D31822D|nr:MULTISPECIES: ornithine carbamoyltransferase [Paenibacillus]KAF6621117.1 ornithine carbamoyltransferase [Paenibacillus sp. EKM101P]KAF6622421.1 ornithine carbamoyltransferase [Paenibacillus sp. EKM102P]KAF6632269.1 ornithine carbamoyltransferase [Paenibacillus sp. EKM10P]KAF6647025.1 ornithine carbamoyltransferase [Paenibacillus sp. EKM11P]PTU47737.1 ornithine carbamoyltransferase [Paenibacillus polymyxa]